MAVAFAREGADVAIVFNSDEKGAQETKRMVERERRRCLAIKADVGREQEVARVYREAVPELGGLDILVNNAAVEQRGTWEEFELDDWDRILRTNLTGYFLMIREALRGGHIKEVPGSSTPDPFRDWRAVQPTWPTPLRKAGFTR